MYIIVAHIAAMHGALFLSLYLGEKLVFFEENYDENYEETAHAKRSRRKKKRAVVLSG